MQSNNTSSRKTFVLGLAGGLCVAAALGAALALGGGRGDGEAQAEARMSNTVSATPAAVETPPAPGAASNDSEAETGESNGESEGAQHGGSDVATATATATATPTATPSSDGCKFCEDGGGLAIPPTATATPGAVCKFCVDGGLAVEPTKVNPCPLCEHPIIGIEPPDTTAPEIEHVAHVELCGTTLYVDFTVSEPSKVWLSYNHDGVYLETDVEHVTDDAHLVVDLSAYGWGVLFIDSFTVHAEDYAGNAATSGPHDMPGLNLGC